VVVATLSLFPGELRPRFILFALAVGLPPVLVFS
jgi:hypothetical protein